MARFLLHFDGSCWPNPGGTAAYGTVLELEGQQEPLMTEAGVIGTSPLMSNNVAEFRALSVGLQWLIDRVQPGDSIDVRGDSQLVVKMMLGDYRPNSEKLYYPYWQEAFKLLSTLEITKKIAVNFTWIPREENTRCDDLSKVHNKAPK